MSTVGQIERQGVDEPLITRALYLLDKAAGDTSKSLYDRNRAVYDLLRYGVKVKPDVGENMQTVWLIDWENPENNHFGVAVVSAIASESALVKEGARFWCGTGPPSSCTCDQKPAPNNASGCYSSGTDNNSRE